MPQLIVNNFGNFLFIQFVSQIIRGFLLNRLQNWENKPEKIHSLTELMWIISSLRKIDIAGHNPFFEEPNETQKAILQEFGITISNEKKNPGSEKAEESNDQPTAKNAN